MSDKLLTIQHHGSKTKQRPEPAPDAVIIEQILYLEAVIDRIPVSLEIIQRSLSQRDALDDEDRC